MAKFKIKERNGLDTIIEKSNHAPTTFKISDIRKHLEAVEKTLIELSSKIDLEKAIGKNIEGKHPEVLKLKEQTRQACYLYMKSKLAIVPAKAKLEELKKSMAEYKKELKEIKSQTGIEIWNEKK